MKAMIISLVSFLILSQISVAQNCTPDSTFINSGSTGIYPDPAVSPNLPDGTVGVPYSTTISFIVPADSVIDLSSILGIPVPPVACDINYLSITTPMLLPTGLVALCEPAICQVPGDSNGCVIISGTPTADGTTPTLFSASLNIFIPASVPIIGGTNIDIPVLYSPFSITILPSTVGIVDTEESASVYPNPFCDELTIDLPGNIDNEVIISIYSEDAKLIQSSTHLSGNKSISMSLSHLENGLYFIVVKNYEGIVITREIIKE